MLETVVLICLAYMEMAQDEQEYFVSFVQKQIALRVLACMVTSVTMHALAQEEVPATLSQRGTPQEIQGNIIPVNLIRGHVSNQPSRYILGPGDTISIRVKNMAEGDQSFTIRPDGYGTVHPFGEMYISGTDVQGLQHWLEEKFKFYLLHPEVSVDVQEMRPALVYVTGAVQKPGTYQYIRKGLSNSSLMLPASQERVQLTLTNVLAQAGGVTEFADITNIQVHHASTGQDESYNLKKLLQSGVGDEDIWLQSDDSIIVSKLDQPMDSETFRLISHSNFYRSKFPVVVLGAVNNQGEVQIDPGNNTMNAAIALAGGFVPKLSKTDKIIVQRPTNNGAFNRWVIDRRKSNMELQPGDVLYITDSKFSTVERGLSVLSQFTQPFFYSTIGLNNVKTLGQN